jgi:hypothetical protein
MGSPIGTMLGPTQFDRVPTCNKNAVNKEITGRHPPHRRPPARSSGTPKFPEVRRDSGGPRPEWQWLGSDRTHVTPGKKPKIAGHRPEPFGLPMPAKSKLRKNTPRTQAPVCVVAKTAGLNAKPSRFSEGLDAYDWELRKEAAIVARSSSAVLQPAPWRQKARAKAPRYVRRSSHLHEMINTC